MISEEVNVAPRDDARAGLGGETLLNPPYRLRPHRLDACPNRFLLCGSRLLTLGLSLALSALAFQTRFLLYSPGILFFTPSDTWSACGDRLANVLVSHTREDGFRKV